MAGPNGVGKSTLFRRIVPRELEYLNADLIAREIKAKAGGLNVQDIANGEVAKIFFQNVAKRLSFSIETNLVDVETYKSFQGIQALGYKIHLNFMCLDDVSVCFRRVRQRVKLGGHNVNPDIVKARYDTALALLNHYKDFPDELVLIDNGPRRFKVQAILNKGIVSYKVADCKDWVNNVPDDRQAKKSKGSEQTIEEVRKRYKKGRSL